MHYYKFNIPDWVLHTSHLEPDEEAIYFRLLNHYYDTELPIPKETQTVLRRLRLLPYSEKVQIILQEYFYLDGNFWYHKRCDFEIEAYHAKAERNRAVGQKGGRPKKTQTDISGLPKETLTKNQELRTNNHIKTIPTPDGVSIDLWSDFLVYRKRLKAPVTQRVLDRLVKEANLAKMPLSEVLETIIFKGWRSFEASWVQQVTGQSAPKNNQEWRNNDGLMMAKASELGLHTVGLQRFEIINKIDATLRSRGI